MAEASDDLGIPMKPARPAGAVATAPLRPPAMPPRAPDLARSGDPGRPADPLRPGEGVRRPSDLTNQPEMRRLSVGREITLSGEINSCDKLFVEGSIEANLNNCRDVEIAETGLFKGSAAIEDAEVRGRFEGNLTVRKRLLIKATGRVSGTIRYGQIEIECGGQISGDIQAQSAGEPGETVSDAVPARAVG
ncbi:MAG TPA: polymer-forming cytoskeletal protein [Stellaceae bacterium]|nr:polymer-forming cytoskeletal protein [Stellaceae bacterium]